MLFFLILFLIISLIVNGIFIWYTKILTKKMLEIYKGVDKFQEYLDGYMKNAEGIYELTDFYGDQTIKGMIEDTKAVVEACQNFKNSIFVEELEEKNETKAE